VPSINLRRIPTFTMMIAQYYQAGLTYILDI